MVVACHLTARKRVEMMIAAMPAVIEAIPQAHLAIAGEGEERENLQRMVERLGLASSVQFLYGDNAFGRFMAPRTWRY